MTNYWTQEDKIKLRDLVEQGLTASVIATYFPGKTRNAVIGVAHRNNLKLKGTAGGSVSRSIKPRQPKQKSASEKKPVKKAFSPSIFEKRLFNKIKVFEQMLKEENLPELPPKMYSPKNKTILDLQRFDCRAIIGPVKGIDTVYCGDNVIEGQSWCAAHSFIYTKPDPRK